MCHRPPTTYSASQVTEPPKPLAISGRICRGGYRHALALLVLVTMFCSGCIAPHGKPVLPDRNQVVRDQLVLHSDFELPDHHRLIDDLVIRRSEISNLLGVRPSDTPIHVYLFENERMFREFVHEQHPTFPNRRALFVKNDESLKIYAMWNPRVGEDLRHEVTHGYLHSVVTGMPLWLDEGIAEFFEVERGRRGLNSAHVYLLANELAEGRWQPDLAKLEPLDDAASMTQLQYAEAWLWTHFLLTNQVANRKPIIQAHLQRLVKEGESFSISEAVAREYPEAARQIVTHLQELQTRTAASR